MVNIVSEFQIYFFLNYLQYKFLHPWPIGLPSDQDNLIYVRIRVLIWLRSPQFKLLIVLNSVRQDLALLEFVWIVLKCQTWALINECAAARTLVVV